jgi:hypothetical protein
MIWLIRLGLLYFWTFLASLMFCYGTGYMQLFSFPWCTQWFEAAWLIRNMWWLPNMAHIPHWPLLWFILGGILPTLLCLTLYRSLSPSNKPQTQQALYGRSAWANQQSMKAGGLISEKRK